MLSPYFPVVSAPLFLAPFGGCYRDITFLNPRETRWKADTLLQSTSLPRLRTWDDWNTEEPLFGQVTLANWAMEALALGMWIKPWKIRRLLNIGMILGDLIWIYLNYELWLYYLGGMSGTCLRWYWTTVPIGRRLGTNIQPRLCQLFDVRSKYPTRRCIRHNRPTNFRMTYYSRSRTKYCISSPAGLRIKSATVCQNMENMSWFPWAMYDDNPLESSIVGGSSDMLPGYQPGIRKCNYASVTTHANG